MGHEVPRTCVDPSGTFICALHQPSYKVINRRQTDALAVLGHDPDGRAISNQINFPLRNLVVSHANGVYEIPNVFPFWGTTYILYNQARYFSEDPGRLRFRKEDDESDQSVPLLKDLLTGSLKGTGKRTYSIKDLPRGLLLTLAQTSRDPEVLKAIAHLACNFELDDQGEPIGLRYKLNGSGEPRPILHDRELFDVLGNNMALPDRYKVAMLLMPGVQGNSPIVGEYISGPQTHIWEYLRANSYIPWGHYASNMAHDSVRYRAEELLPEDIMGLRHLYYQRVYTQMALNLNIALGNFGKEIGPISETELESLRKTVVEKVAERQKKGKEIAYTATLWGWNYGFDFSPSGYRLHASHQQIHQQYALIPPYVRTVNPEGSLPESIPTYAVGDQVARFAALYERSYGIPFFETYLKAIHSNRRLDGREDLPASLIVYEDRDVMVHVPKAQRCHGEVQIMTTGHVGNVLEAGPEIRRALDLSIRLVIRTMGRLGAQMVTCYEVSKRFDSSSTDQRLFYCFLPRLPGSPGAFSERQGRWITGHYPEDYAEAFRRGIKSLQSD